MDALDNMRIRLQYNGGTPQQSRMIEDKLKSLKKALLYSYQAGTMIIDNPNENNELPKQMEFRCLMNPDKRTFDADKMMLSVPFEDICLNAPRIGKTTEGIVPVPIKCGSVYTWKETATRWIVTLQYIEEYAYFRADVRKCYPYPLVLDGKEYYFAAVGQNEETIEWTRRNHEEWNKMNYTRTLYIERNDQTLNYFKRFKIVKLPNIQGELETWEVQAVAPNATDDVLIIHFREYFENKYEEVSAEEQAKIQEQHELQEDFVCTAYDKIKFTTKYISEASWSIKNKTDGLRINIDDAIINGDNTTIYMQLMNSKAGEFDVYYGDSKIQHVVVKSI
jgi:hypothetical protein